MIRTLKECPEVGNGALTVLDQPMPPAVLAHRFDAHEGTLLLLHNLDGDAVTVDIGPQQDVAVETPREVFADDDVPHADEVPDWARPQRVRLPVDPAAPRLGRLTETDSRRPSIRGRLTTRPSGVRRAARRRR